MCVLALPIGSDIILEIILGEGWQLGPSKIGLRNLVYIAILRGPSSFLRMVMLLGGILAGFAQGFRSGIKDIIVGVGRG